MQDNKVERLKSLILFIACNYNNSDYYEGAFEASDFWADDEENCIVLEGREFDPKAEEKILRWVDSHMDLDASLTFMEVDGHWCWVEDKETARVQQVRLCTRTVEAVAKNFPESIPALIKAMETQEQDGVPFFIDGQPFVGNLTTYHGLKRAFEINQGNEFRMEFDWPGKAEGDMPLIRFEKTVFWHDTFGIALGYVEDSPHHFFLLLDREGELSSSSRVSNVLNSTILAGFRERYNGTPLKQEDVLKIAATMKEDLASRNVKFTGQFDVYRAEELPHGHMKVERVSTEEAPNQDAICQHLNDYLERAEIIRRRGPITTEDLRVKFNVQITKRERDGNIDLSLHTSNRGVLQDVRVHNAVFAPTTAIHPILRKYVGKPMDQVLLNDAATDIFNYMKEYHPDLFLGEVSVYSRGLDLNTQLPTTKLLFSIKD